MVNDDQTIAARNGWAQGRDAERRLAISYAPGERRAAVQALLELDDALAAILQTTTEPTIAQMRLAWWHDALSSLDGQPPRKTPVLEALAAHVLPLGIRGAELALLVEPWDALVEGAVEDEDTRRAYADARARLFVLTARILGDDRHDVAPAGRAWALADLAVHVSDAALSQAIAADAVALAERAMAVRWPAALRVLGALGHQARMDAKCWTRGERPAVATPGRVFRLGWHRLTGR